MKKFFVMIRRFGSDVEFSTCVLAQNESFAETKGLVKICKKLGFDGFCYDDVKNSIGDFYTNTDNGMSFYIGSRACYVVVHSYSADVANYCYKSTHQIH